MGTTDMSSNVLRRYTTLPVALDVLTFKRVALLDPAGWQDRADAFFMDEYAKRLGCGGVRAACLTSSAETFHHWSVYADREGVCFVFRPNHIEDAARQAGFQCREVAYWGNLTFLFVPKPQTEDLPFLKGLGYQDEREVRIVGQCDTGAGPLYLPISLDMIAEVVVSPWLPLGLLPALQRSLRNAAGHEELQVRRSPLLDNYTMRALALRPDEALDEDTAEFLRRAP
jgi:hypothetical protein